MKNILIPLTFSFLCISVLCQEPLTKRGTNGYGVNIDLSNGVGGKFVVSNWGKKNNETQFSAGFAITKNPNNSIFIGSA
jgi:hypothetical protein